MTHQTVPLRRMVSSSSVRQFRCGVHASVLWLAAATATAGLPLIELRTADGPHRGRVYTTEGTRTWLLDRDGTLRGVPIAGITAYAVAEPEFRPLSTLHLRDRLRRELGRSAEVIATQHYVVAGRPGVAGPVATALEEVQTGYRRFCASRRLPSGDPEFPLVAVVLPDPTTFAAQCRADGVTPAEELQGYYGPLSNRFVLYETGAIAAGVTSAAARGTLTHEAVHQLAFNTGLHARLGDTPLWVAEGLATALEPEAARRTWSAGAAAARVNRERLLWFLALTERDSRTLGRVSAVDLIVSDAPFRTAPLDAYAVAWAMTFYALENHPGDTARYLRKLSEGSDATKGPRDRQAEFTAVFGDPTRFESEAIRFCRRIASDLR